MLQHQHYGRENIVRNNIFAYGREGVVGLGRAEAHNSFTLLGNLLLTDGQPLYAGGYVGQVERRGIRSDLNLLWNTGDQPLVSGDAVADANANWSLVRSYSLDEWRALGHDRRSLVTDPRFRNLERRDFTLADDSPMFELGSQPLDLSGVGPRAETEWGE